VRYPGNIGGEVDDLVSAIDIAPTIDDMTGARATIPQDGVSLVPFLLGETPPDWRTSLLFEWKGDTVQKQGFYAVRTDRYLYAELYSGKVVPNVPRPVTFRELYDLQTDPYELTNLAGDPDDASLQDELANELARLKTSSGVR
jgi:arylsulfatase A-like enzyme